ncbi:acyltransferase domain-containing protein [Streptomyces lasiicapitis]|uniref:acyltransferase domain-containing protein n=1 Tax=Streptomyces lasiicapitis TaxID=1923961 RepID=UPI00166C5D0C|nr:acyltransferase domain-containing protein [Streptomyces lasiicapitis]
MLDVLRAAAERDSVLAAWLRALEDGGEPPAEAVLPDADELPDVLLDLGVPHEDINALVALRGRVLDDPDTRWLLTRCVALLLRDLGAPEQGPRLPVLPAELGELGSCFYVFVFIAALPRVRAYHLRHGIPDDVSRRSLADLGRHMAVHRRTHGSRGVPVPGWNALHFRGELYQLGRLQFQRSLLGERMGAAIAAAGVGLGPGDPCLSVHVADFRGPLSAAACDLSVELAREFFPRHFPGERYDVVVCHSWLLDPQLKRYLDAESNIVRFQERFRLADTYGGEAPDDSVPVGFVFGDRLMPVERLPRRTRVERAIGDHLRGGGHWYAGHGWFPLERPQARPFP